MSCIFCDIISGTIPSLKVYEDEHTLVFMDIAKDVDGHMVAIPKKHVTNIFDCDSETLSHLMDTVKLVSMHCIETCGYTGVNILNANDESAGQTVFHFHIHIIPRKTNDGLHSFPTFSGANHSIVSMHELLKIH